MDDNFFEIHDEHFQAYETYLKEPYRPPSKKGNTKALHLHVITINGEKYSFFALDAQKFAHKGETISFLYKKIDKNEKIYFNIEKHSIITKDAKGNEYQRGNRDSKPKLRTASTRMPGSRREQR